MDYLWEMWIIGTARLWAILAAQPLWRMVSGGLWPIIGGVIALSLAYPKLEMEGIVGGTTMPLGRFAWSVGIELLFGAILGFVASLPGYALVGAIWQSEANINPENRSVAFRLLCLTMLLSLAILVNAHFPLLAGLHEILEIVPAGAPESCLIQHEKYRLWWAVDPVARLAHSILLLSFSLATPILAISCAIELVVSGLKKGGSSFPFHWQVVHPWIRLTICLIGLGISWRAFPEIWLTLSV